MEIVRLRKGKWRYDPNDQLGPEGGFGAVFRGASDDGSPVAVKRLKVNADDVGHRELAIRDFNDLRIPPANRLESLKGDRKGQFSIRINDQWRICFEMSLV